MKPAPPPVVAQVPVVPEVKKPAPAAPPVVAQVPVVPEVKKVAPAASADDRGAGAACAGQDGPGQIRHGPATRRHDLKTDPLQTPDLPPPSCRTRRRQLAGKSVFPDTNKPVIADTNKPVIADTNKPVQLVQNTTDTTDGATKPPFTPKRCTSTSPPPTLPLGMGSVMAAKTTEPAAPPKAPVTSPYDGGNAFSPAPPPTSPNQGKPALASRGQAMPPAPNQINLAQATNPAMGQMPMPPMPPIPPQGYTSIPMDRGMPSGAANAFTTPAPSGTRPMPPDFGRPNTPGNAFAQPVQGPQQMMVPQMARSTRPWWP